MTKATADRIDDLSGKGFFALFYGGFAWIFATVIQKFVFGVHSWTREPWMREDEFRIPELEWALAFKLAVPWALAGALIFWMVAGKLFPRDGVCVEPEYQAD